MSEGCRNCYAMHMAARFSGPGQPYDGLALSDPPRWTGQVRLIREHLDDPLRWRRPRRVFVNSMSDLFHESLPFETVAEVVAVMVLAQWHTFQVLTKRPERMAQFLNTGLPLIVAALERRGTAGQAMAVRIQQDIPVAEGMAVKRRWPLPNVWWGMTAEDDAALVQRIGFLEQCRPAAAVLWISCEPMLAPIRLDRGYRHLAFGIRCAKCGAISEDWEYSRSRWGAPPVCQKCHDVLRLPFPVIDLVVVGGEAGPGARLMAPEWPRILLDDVRRAWKLTGNTYGPAFHFKQWGDWAEDGRKIGKKLAGRMLDGRTWDELPGQGAGNVQNAK